MSDRVTVGDVAAFIFWGGYILAMFAFFNFVAWTLWHPGSRIMAVFIGVMGNFTMIGFVTHAVTYEPPVQDSTLKEPNSEDFQDARRFSQGENISTPMSEKATLKEPNLKTSPGMKGEA